VIATLIWKPVAIGAVAFAIFAVPSAYLKGRSDGKAAERAATFQAIERQRSDRNDINESVRSLDDAGLCHDLGGVFDNGECQ
jgi:hypothetical protein